MKIKPFIGKDDFVINPDKSFDKRIPFFTPCGTTERGHINYGVSCAVQYANRKADPIIKALAAYFRAGEGKEEAERQLLKIVEEYTDKEDD